MRGFDIVGVVIVRALTLRIAVIFTFSSLVVALGQLGMIVVFGILTRAPRLFRLLRLFFLSLLSLILLSLALGALENLFDLILHRLSLGLTDFALLLRELV